MPKKLPLNSSYVLFTISSCSPQLLSDFSHSRPLKYVSIGYLSVKHCSTGTSHRRCCGIFASRGSELFA